MFSPDTQIRKVSSLVTEMFQKVLYDEEPLFVSDEATLWAVSMSDPNDVLERFRKYYRVPLSFEETKQLPLWKLLLMIQQRREALPTEQPTDHLR
jgi:hypothetical protein